MPFSTFKSQDSVAKISKFDNQKNNYVIIDRVVRYVVFERICSFDPPDSQSLIVCRSGLTCVAVACSLRLLFRNVNTGDEEDKKKVVSIGHLTECYSQDKVVQLVHTRKQSDFWFEILQQKKFSVAVTTYEMLKAIPRRQTYAFTTYCFDLPESVQELTLLYR